MFPEITFLELETSEAIRTILDQYNSIINADALKQPIVSTVLLWPFVVWSKVQYVQWLGVCASCACDDESKKSENILVLRTVRLSSVSVE